MGYRLHYATKYEVEFAGGYFNWQTAEVNQLLAELGVVMDDDNCQSYEISKEEFRTSVNAIKAEYQDKANEPHPLIAEYTYCEVLAVLEEIINNTPGDYIHLEWF